jgi:hypothetical protein
MSSVADLKSRVAKSDAGRRFKPSAFLNRKGDSAVAVVNHRDAYRGVSPMLICEIVEHADEAVAAAMEALDYASKPETLEALQEAKANGKGKSGNGESKTKLAALAAQLKERQAQSEE